MVIRVAFCCLGNICRSTMAEAVFNDTVKKAGLEDKFEIDSFGTGAYHAGDPPDRRSKAECKKHGIEMNHRAQRIHPKDIEHFDYILAMDDMNYEDLRDMAKTPQLKQKIHLFGEYRTDKSFDKIVSDPYYGGANGFAENFKQISHFSEVFLRSVME